MLNYARHDSSTIFPRPSKMASPQLHFGGAVLNSNCPYSDTRTRHLDRRSLDPIDGTDIVICYVRVPAGTPACFGKPGSGCAAI